MSQIDELSRVANILSPCKFSQAIRQQAYTQSELSSAQYGSFLRFTLPNNTSLDLSQSYMDFDVLPVNRIAEVAQQFQINKSVPNVPITGGDWQLIWDGSSVSDIPFGPGTTAAQVVTAINTYYKFEGRGLTAATTTPTNSFDQAGVPGNFMQFQISGFGNLDRTSDSISAWSVLWSTFSAGAPVVAAPIGVTSANFIAGVQATPLIELSSPFFQRMYIQINGTTVFDVVSANRLSAALSFVDKTFDSLGKRVEDGYEEFGVTFSKIKLRFKMDWVDLFRSIFPLEILNNAQIVIYFTLENPNLCLICSDAANSAQQGYVIQNAKLKYHTLILKSEDKKMIKDKIDSSDGLIIPYVNWGYFNATIPSGSTNQNVIFNPNCKNLLGLIFLFVSQPYYADATNHRKLTTFLRNNINSYRLKVGNLYFPLDKVEVANSYYALAEQVRELVGVVEIANREKVVDDMEVFLNLAGTSFQGTSPTDAVYNTYFQENINMHSIMGIACCDVGYSDKTHLCDRIALQGIDTSSLPNVVLELEGMTVLQNEDINIFYLSQDYIVFKRNSFVWLH